MKKGDKRILLNPSYRENMSSMHFQFGWNFHVWKIIYQDNSVKHEFSTRNHEILTLKIIFNAHGRQNNLFSYHILIRQFGQEPQLFVKFNLVLWLLEVWAFIGRRSFRFLWYQLSSGLEFHTQQQRAGTMKQATSHKRRFTSKSFLNQTVACVSLLSRNAPELNFMFYSLKILIAKAEVH